MKTCKHRSWQQTFDVETWTNRCECGVMICTEIKEHGGDCTHPAKFRVDWEHLDGTQAVAYTCAVHVRRFKRIAKKIQELVPGTLDVRVTLS